MSNVKQCGEWFGECSSVTEEAFRQKLKRLKAGGSENGAISQEVVKDPFLCGLIQVETSRGFFGKTPETRSSWRAETLILIGAACKKRGMLGCDPDRPNIGGFWRTVVRRKASNARRTLVKEMRPLPKGSVHSGRLDPVWVPTECTRALDDLRLDLRMAVAEIEDARVRLIMTKLMSSSYTMSELATELGLTVNQIRYDIERGKAALRRALR